MMSNRPNQDRSNRQKARRAKREAARVPGKGAGQPVPIRAPEGQPSASSLADLAKAGAGQVPLSIPQLMAKVGALTIERDFWMNAAVELEGQMNELTGGVTAPSLEAIAAAEEESEEEIQDIPVTVTECPGCGVTLGADATHADDCQFQEHEFEDEEAEEPAKIGANVPAETQPTPLTVEQQAVVDEATKRIAEDGGQHAPPTLEQVEALQEEAPE